MPREDGMDALSLLKEDHDKVRKMLEELDSTTERGVKTREELFQRVKHELEVHEDRGGDLLSGAEGPPEDQGAHPRGL